jgi:glycosyltransferase involved in cell wall biosynthesis
VFLQSYPEIAKLYRALDLYVVSSRQEGGPKAVLESMATGVPLVTTHVGQAMDLVRHGENAYMTAIEDVEALAFYSLQVYRSNEADLQSMLAEGLKTAKANSYVSQIPLWAEFMKGFVG